MPRKHSRSEILGTLLRTSVFLRPYKPQLACVFLLVFAVSLLSTMVGIVYFNKKKGVTPPNSDTAIKVSTSAGTVIGQFGFGALADIVGRKRMYGLELIVIIVATLAQALVGVGPSTEIVGLLIFWRVIMGIGM